MYEMHVDLRLVCVVTFCSNIGINTLGWKMDFKIFHAADE